MTPASVATVVVATDGFKGSCTSAAASAAIAGGWRSVRPQDTVILMPMADGGEGTMDAFEAAVPGAVRRPVVVTGPDGRPARTHWLLLPPTTATPGGTGVVELAATSGITMLRELRPFDADTTGFGEAIVAALDHGVSRLLLGVGGSASTDGGAGALRALGLRLLDASGDDVAPGNRGLQRLATIDRRRLRRMPPGGAAVLTDVVNPLLGASGAAMVFGRQKGAEPSELADMDASLARYASLLGGMTDTPGAGAAGGTGFGLANWGATIVSGAAAVADALGLAAALDGADLAITGEGRFDSQSAGGKAPAHVWRLAHERGVPTALIAGGIDGPTDAFVTSTSLSELAGSAAAAMADPFPYLSEAAARLAAAFQAGRDDAAGA